MFTTRYLHLEHSEVLKWLAILTLASLMAALAARMATGGDAIRPLVEPARLPAAIERYARPMDLEPNPATPAGQVNTALQLWTILAEQKQGNFEHVIGEWQLAPLSCEMEVWRHVALAQAHLGRRDLSTALDSLDTALALDHENAVARYFRGVLRLEQAAAARDWPDALGPVQFRLVSTRPVEPSLTRSMYRLAARMELEQALESAAAIRFDDPLCFVQTPTSLALEPTVRDLLIALGAEDFEGKAHHLLSYIMLEEGAAREAEQHLDMAAALGQKIIFGYEDLGALYQRQHEHLDAVRAYTKALAHGSPPARPTARIVRNLRLAVIEAF